MGPSLEEKVADRNRRQKLHAFELRLHAIEHRYMSRAAAQRKIERSRRRIAVQVARSKRKGREARRRAEEVGRRARRRVQLR